MMAFIDYKCQNYCCRCEVRTPKAIRHCPECGATMRTAQRASAKCQMRRKIRMAMEVAPICK